MEEVRKVDGIIIRANGKVTRKMMESDPKLKVIGRHGVGVENIDPEAARQRRIWIVNAPNANDISVGKDAVRVLEGKKTNPRGQSTSDRSSTKSILIEIG